MRYAGGSYLVCCVGGAWNVSTGPRVHFKDTFGLVSACFIMDGDGCIMRCEMKLGASRRVLVGSFRHARHVAQHLPGRRCNFLGPAQQNPSGLGLSIERKRVHESQKKYKPIDIHVMCDVFLLACSFNSPVQSIRSLGLHHPATHQ
jgi:hypothetical protein